jgi:hypothetical protein
LDSALNELLMPTDKIAEQVFMESFLNGKINDVETYLPNCTKIVYANADMDFDLLDANDLEIVKLDKSKIENYIDKFRSIKKIKEIKGFDRLPEEDKELFNTLNWLCLYRKGLLMLAAYKKTVIPKIKAVHAVQREIKLENGDGDSIVGFIDLVADIEDYGVCILDNKTSARDYLGDSVVLSAQLSLYLHAIGEEFNTRRCGYIVMNKNILKHKVKICADCGFNGSGSQFKTCNNKVNGVRCSGGWLEKIAPEARIQIIIDDIPENTEDLVVTNYDEVAKAIKNNAFPKNLGTCSNYFGGKCPYFYYCYHNKNNDLIKVEEKIDG